MACANIVSDSQTEDTHSEDTTDEELALLSPEKWRSKYMKIRKKYKKIKKAKEEEKSCFKNDIETAKEYVQDHHLSLLNCNVHLDKNKDDPDDMAPPGMEKLRSLVLEELEQPTFIVVTEIRTHSHNIEKSKLELRGYHGPFIGSNDENEVINPSIFRNGGVAIWVKDRPDIKIRSTDIDFDLPNSTKTPIRFDCKAIDL